MDGSAGTPLIKHFGTWSANGVLLDGIELRIAVSDFSAFLWGCFLGLKYVVMARVHMYQNAGSGHGWPSGFCRYN